MTKAIEIKFAADLKGFAVFVDGAAITKGYGLKENAVFKAKCDFPGEVIAVFKRNGDFQKNA